MDAGILQIIEFTGENASDARICKNVKNFDELPRAGPIYIVVYKPGESFAVQETIARANSLLGEADYNALINNCEHFATWCKTGHSFSVQEIAAEVSIAAGVGLVALSIAAGAIAILARK